MINEDIEEIIIVFGKLIDDYLIIETIDAPIDDNVPIIIATVFMKGELMHLYEFGYDGYWFWLDDCGAIKCNNTIRATWTKNYHPMPDWAIGDLNQALKGLMR